MGNLDRAHDGELLLEVLLQGGGDDALGVALHLEGGVAVHLVGGDGGGEGLLSTVVDLAGEDEVLHGGVGEQQVEGGEVVLGSKGGEAHVRDGVGNADSDGNLGGDLAVILAAGELGVQATGEGAGTSTDGGLGLGKTVDIEFTGEGGSGVNVLEGHISLIGIISLELDLEAGKGVDEGGLDGQLKVVGELKLLQSEAGSVRVLKGDLRL